MISPLRLHLRAAFFRFIRSFFQQQDFLEVDTPVRIPELLPEANIVPVDMGDGFLQTSPELCMKRLLIKLPEQNGNIFQICHCFRKEERGRLHLEEFQMLEWYRKGTDYFQLMEDCKSLLKYLSDQLQKMEITGRDKPESKLDFFKGVDLNSPWQSLTVSDAFSRYCPVSVEDALRANEFDKLLVEFVEPNLGRGKPTFLYDYPVQLGSLARVKESELNVVERFELYINGVELANGFSELTDPVEQRARFEKEIAEIEKSRGETASIPEKFLRDLEFLGETAGIALGIDRLFMIALNLDDISEAVSFGPEDFD